MASVKRFNWIREPTAWQRVQQRRASHAEISQRAMEYGAAASNNFASAQIGMTTGMSTISAQVANQRVQAQASAARNQLNSAFGSVNTVA
jgi:hypothetical protein